MSDFSAEFIEEAREKLECFRSVFLAIEQSGVCIKLLNEAFRAIHTIKGSGAMVGFRHLADSIHHLETELDTLRKGDVGVLSEGTIDRFLRWSDYVETYLNGLAHDPSYTLNPGDLLAAVAPNQNKLVALSPATSSEILTDLSSERARSVSQIFPVHYRSYLAASSSVSEDTSWSLLALSALGLPDAQPEKFAETALDIVRTQCNMSDVARICLVRRIGLSNQYESVSAASVQRNLMQRGTRCYVHPDSSLARIGPGYVRVLDIPAAMDHYAGHGRRPQRVVKALSEAGYKSGICLGVGTSDHNLGYLFVNASTEFLLRVPRRSLPILSELGKHAARHIRELPCPESLYFQIFDQTYELMQGRRLLRERVEAAYAQAALVFGSAPLTFKQPSAPLPPALISHANIGYLLARMASRRGISHGELSIFADHRRIVFNCQFSKAEEALHPDYLSASRAVADALGFEMDCPSPDTVQFSTLFDPCLDVHTKYSA